MGKPGFPIPLLEGVALPNPPAGGGMGEPGSPIPLRGRGVGKPGFPTPLAEGLCSRQEGAGGRGPRASDRHPQGLGDGENILIAATGQIDQDKLVGSQPWGELQGLGDGVGALERGNDPLQARA